MPKTKKQTNEKENLKISKEKMETFLDGCLDSMKKKQDDMLRTYNFGRKNNNFIFYPKQKKFYLFDSKTNKAFFEAQFQVVGTFSPKSNTWRFGWANRYVPHDLKKTSLKLKEFGESNGLNIFSEPKVKDDKLGLVFTAIAMKLSHAKGYYIVPAEGKFPEVHLIFTKIRKIRRSMKTIKGNTEKNNLTKKKKYLKLIK